MIRDASTMDQPIEGSRSRRLRWILLVTGLLVVCAALLSPALMRWAGSETSIDRDRVRLGSVTRGDLVRELSVEGRVVAAFHPTLYSPQSGIVAIEIRAGAVISEGEAVARIASPELESRLDQERSRLLSAAGDAERQEIRAKQMRLRNAQSVSLLEVELEAARRAMDRAERSRKLGIVNDVDYERAQDDIRIGELTLDHARRSAEFEDESLDFEVQDSRSRLERQRLVVADLERQVSELTIRSPVSGLVSRLHIEDREAVDRNDPLVTVVDLSAFEIEVSISESAADEIAAGTPAIVTVGGVEHEAVVRSVSPEVEAHRVMGVVTFGDTTPQGLRQNQRVQTRLILDSRPDVLKAPRGPFLEASAGRLAYVVSDDGVAVLREIEIGSTSLSEVEILSGLEEGEEIILSDTSRFEGARQVLLR